MREVRLVPDWTGILPGLLLIYTDGERAQDRRWAMAEMLRAARLADAFVTLAVAVDSGEDTRQALALIRAGLVEAAERRRADESSPSTDRATVREWLAVEADLTPRNG
jgi:hypothetical protein